MRPARQNRKCVSCPSIIRPAGVKIADAPGTAQWGAKGECSRCAQHARDRVRADEVAAVSPETMAIVSEMVARRAPDLAQMLGIAA